MSGRELTVGDLFRKYFPLDSYDPGFYGGHIRALNLVSDNMLKTTYRALEQELGPAAGVSFTRMIADMPEGTMTYYLLSLCNLMSAQWAYEGFIPPSERGYPPIKNAQPVDRASGSFLWQHAGDLPEEVRQRLWPMPYGTAAAAPVPPAVC